MSRMIIIIYILFSTEVKSNCFNKKEWVSSRGGMAIIPMPDLSRSEFDGENPI